MTGFASMLERAARDCIAARRAGERRRAERGVLAVLDLLEPRIGRLTRDYGLLDMADDAGQACAIGIHRALESYAPGKARFTTHATWQMRGELQSLRHRMCPEQRQGARKAGFRQITLENGCALAGAIVDHETTKAVESAASDTLALRALRALLETADQPKSERPLVVATLLDQPVPPAFAGHSSEERRQIVRRNLRHCARAAAA